MRWRWTSPKDRDLERIEELVNEKVQENLRVDPLWTELDQALKLGALALFGEKYGQRVRMVQIGDFSKELCGGTHLDATGQIGLFKVIAENAVAAGRKSQHYPHNASSKFAQRSCGLHQR